MYKKLLLLLMVLYSLSYAQEIEIKKSYLIDKESVFTTENIYENRDKFSTLSPSQTSFGLSDSTIWFYIKLTNTTDKKISNYIEFPYPIIDYILLQEYENGVLKESYTTGDLTVFNSRKVESNTFIFPTTLNPHQTKELIFKINSQGALNLKMNFFLTDEYFQSSKNNFMVLGIYYGAIIIMLLYNFILYLMIKERVYLNYVMFHFTYLSLQLGFNGLAFQYFWPDNPTFNYYHIPIFFMLANYFSITFAISFLNIKERYKKIYQYLTFYKYTYLVLLLLTLFLPYNMIVKSMAVASILSVSSLFIVSIYILIKEHSSSSKFFVTAWSFLLLGVLLTEFQNIGILPMSFYTLYGAQVGAFMELALLSFALAHRYNTIFLKLSKTEFVLKVLNKNLELKVEQRTKSLNDKNLQLSLELNNKNILLRELFHRVKNNLQIISSLLSLQSRRIEHKIAKSIFDDTTQRIKSMAMIHEKLYQSDNLEAIDIQDYIKSLIDDLKQTIKGSHIHFKIDCENNIINLDSAVPIGLIMNELITNAIKYAFNENDENKQITIKMYLDLNSDKLILEVIDNGKGIVTENIKNGFGFKLIHTLAVYLYHPN